MSGAIQTFLIVLYNFRDISIYCCYLRRKIFKFLTFLNTQVNDKFAPFCTYVFYEILISLI